MTDDLYYCQTCHTGISNGPAADQHEVDNPGHRPIYSGPWRP